MYVIIEVLHFELKFSVVFSLVVVLVPQMYGLPQVYQQSLKELWETTKSIKRSQKVGLRRERGEKE